MMKRFVETGTLRIIDAGGREHVYAGRDGPEVTIRLTDPKLHRSLALNPELKAGEAYMDGTLVVEDGTIRDLLTLFAMNRSNLRRQPLQKSLRRLYKRFRAFSQRNTLSKARSHVAHHYDLSNDLYRMFLDEDLNYSCGYFLNDDDSIEAAQQNKLRHIAAKLDLRPGQRVLDIGSGWGGMAMFMAEAYDVEVVGVTLSSDQQSLATERARQRGLDKRVSFELQDYRNVTENFDRIVSIGMFEHVGVDHHREFFDKVSSILPKDGVALLHSIGRAGGPGATGRWLSKYIFPGGYSPALSEALSAVEGTGLLVTDVEILRRHYAETLLAWDTRFQARRAEVAELFDERFCRMWEFYLIVCELGFRYGKQVIFQMQMAKSLHSLPITRDYMADTEKTLLRSEEARRAAA
ncbi:MAG: class I SAM-dependent methyltransferase [Geminicoccaceae bacterium]